MSLFGGAYDGLRVVVTGHTGFKGSWLALWLKELGAEVTGVALAPEASPNHWDLLALEVTDERLDIRNHERLADIVRRSNPQIVFHLAAQPLVRRSYRDPIETWSTNVIGSANVLEACRQSESVRAVLVVTTDKCYENREWPWGYRETDRLGGHDPYSASKAAVELLSASYRSSYFNAADGPLLATARAGNVIGGGDWSEDRLVPDLMRSHVSRTQLEVRSPSSTRPWQHVLESASAYLLLGQRLLEGKKEFAQAWNFGPDSESKRTVGELLEAMRQEWPTLSWSRSDQSHPHESGLLWLDISKAREHLRWAPVWDFRKTVNKTAAWYEEFYSSGVVSSRAQLAEYVRDARAAGAAWAE